MLKITSSQTMLIIMCFASLTVGCMRAPVVPPVGQVYNDFTAPLDTNVNNTEMGSKQGESSCYSILGLVSLGDASISTAAKNGKISKVMHADYKYFNILGVYQEYTTVVYGE